MNKILIVRQGATRVVLLVGKYALKIPNFFNGLDLFLSGFQQNRTEGMLSKTKNQKLCPVKLCLPLGLLVIMPRVDVLEREDFDKYDLDTLFTNYHDRKFNNLGWLGGKIVILDYGLGERG